MLRRIIRSLNIRVIRWVYGGDSELYQIVARALSLSNSTIDITVKLYPPYRIDATTIDSFSYVAENSKISNTNIGKFCSIGPNLFCGWGIHPLNGISTNPMFYSTMRQNGTTLSQTNKVIERAPINIGNDVFIGMNVTILDGVTIGNGAVIGAGAVVSKDIPDYAIAVGCPVKIIGYRFENDTIEKLLQIKWWDFDMKDLQSVEQYFFEVQEFIKHAEKQKEILE